jgi:ribosomal protein L7Ae-like RNA K-turn-binding protein
MQHEADAHVVELAENLASLLKRLKREKKLLIGAELRVEHLVSSIAALTVAAEDARAALVAAIPTES